MFQKAVIIVGVSALVGGLFVVNASAKQRHHIRHVATVAKVEPMKATVGNNPLTVVASTRDRSGRTIGEAGGHAGQQPDGDREAEVTILSRLPGLDIYHRA